MQVVVNGHSREVADGSSVASLLADLQVQTERVAVELNLQIVDRGAFAVTALRPGDRIEVIGFIGGGGGHA
jgi:sulfur carrier protein